MLRLRVASRSQVPETQPRPAQVPHVSRRVFGLLMSWNLVWPYSESVVAHAFRLRMNGACADTDRLKRPPYGAAQPQHQRRDESRRGRLRVRFTKESLRREAESTSEWVKP